MRSVRRRDEADDLRTSVSSAGASGRRGPLPAPLLSLNAIVGESVAAPDLAIDEI